MKSHIATMFATGHEREYPCLVVKENAIVLATDDDTGVLVHGALVFDGDNYTVGEAFYDDFDEWEVYSGSVTLAN